MNSENITSILTILSTMQGFPSMPALRPSEKMDPVRLTYAALLSKMPDSLAKPIRNNVLLRFDQRPSVKNLADWAASLGPAETFDILQLDCKEKSAPHRLGDPKIKRLGSPEGGVSAFAVQVLPGPASREIIARLKEKAKTSGGADGPCEYGLEFEILEGFAGAGRITRTCPRATKAACVLAAEDRNERWRHQITRVYHRDDPPRRTGNSIPAERSSIPAHEPKNEQEINHAQS